MTNTHNVFPHSIGTPMSKELMDDLDEDVESFIKKTDKEIYLSLKPASNEAYALDSVTGELIPVTDVQYCDIGIQGDFFSHLPLKGTGYVVSEGQTAVKLSAGPDREQAVLSAMHKVSAFISKHGEEAFYKLLNTQKAQLKNENLRYKAIHVDLVKPIEQEVSSVVIEEHEPHVSLDLRMAVDQSLNYKNLIDIDYISDILNEDSDSIREQILDKGFAFENPLNGNIEAPDEYLSGNVRIKLEQAEQAAVSDSSYAKNVESLKAVIPPDIPASLIQHTLGAAWIPLNIFENFATGIFKTKIDINYLASSGKFSAKSRIGYKTVQIHNTYAAGTKNGLEILIATLNNQQMVISEQVYEDGKTKTQKNLEYTSAAQSMQEQLQEEFHQYIMASEEIQLKTEKIYNRIFNGTVERNYRTPDFLHYPGASQHIFLREHQKKGVLRSLYESTLLAHSVGTGKTWMLITTAMEMRRLGLAKKPLIAVQNKTRGQFASAFYDLYPNANVLVPTQEELSAYGKPYLYQRIANEDWDAIIIPHSQMDLIPDDLDRQRALIKSSIDEAQDVLNNINKKVMPMEYAHANRTVKALRKELDQIDIDEETRKKEANKAAELFGTVPLLNFEQLNVDALLIDEFHRYKRLGFSTSLSNIKGIDTAKSKRSQSMLLKMRYVQEMNGGRNTLGYTGTPISNTMAEAWTMIRYFRPDILKQMGIEHFDQFVKTFGQIIPSLEQTGGGTFKIQNRFAKFQNLPEFISAFRATTDVVLAEDVQEFILNNTIPKLKGEKITQVPLPQSPELREVIADFRRTLEWYEELEGPEKRQFNYIPLVIFGRAKQAAIDLRLLSPANPDLHNSKVNRVIKNALKVYFDTGNAQMIFCDLYQSPEPKEQYLDEDCQVPNPAYGLPRFHLFNDIRDKLIANGIKPAEIAVMSESKWDKQEKLDQLFIDANSGKVKFLIGSTERLGVGINAQQKLIAVHHIDAPARPMDFEQRNGRILRQGNENEEVWIFAYGVEKTLDSAAFQRLSTKQKFINQIMKGQNVERITEDPADEAQMTFDEMMACLSDSPFAAQKLLVDNRLRAEKVKKDNFYGKLVQTQRQLNNGQEELARLNKNIAEETKYAKWALEAFPESTITSLKIGSNTFTEEFTEAADGYIDMLIERYNESATLSARGAIMTNGIKVNILVDNVEKMSQKTKMMYNAPSISYTIPEIGIFPNIYDKGISVRNTGTSLIINIEREIDSIINKPKYAMERIQKHEVAIAELQRTMNAEFDETKLHALEAESSELKQKMIDESNKPKEEYVLLTEDDL